MYDRLLVLPVANKFLYVCTLPQPVFQAQFFPNACNKSSIVRILISLKRGKYCMTEIHNQEHPQRLFILPNLCSRISAGNCI